MQTSKQEKQREKIKSCTSDQSEYEIMGATFFDWSLACFNACDTKVIAHENYSDNIFRWTVHCKSIRAFRENWYEIKLDQ